MAGSSLWGTCVVAAAVGLGGCYGGLDVDDGASGSSPQGDDNGDDGDGDGETGEPEAPGCNGAVPQIAARPLQRLTPRQYQNTIRDLFGDAEFDTTYDDEEVITTERGVRQFRDDASAVTARKDQWTVEVFGCDTAGAADDQCASEFVENFGPEVFRRPLTDEDRGRLLGAYDLAKAEFGFADAMDIVLETMLQSSAFVYIGESGTPVDGAPDNIRQLTDHEVASRLSYFLWDTMPDQPLFEAAAAGELTGKAGLRAHVERMLADGRAESKIQRFMWEWLQLDGGQLHFSLEESDKDTALFPDYGPVLQEAMRLEFEGLVKDVVLDSEDASLENLLTTNRAYVNGPMADLYGVAAGPMDEGTWAWVDLDPQQRTGLLTRAAFLTVFSSSNVQSPIRRGTFVIEEMLCSQLGTPPPNVDDTPVEPTEGGTVREATEARTQGAECQGCHQVINPAGFPFENYNAIGTWQTQETLTGLPIDASGELIVGDQTGPVANAIELSEKLAASAVVRECFAGRWLGDATGADVGSLDDCAQEDILAQFEETKNIRELIIAIVLSDSFRYLNTEGGE